MAISIELPEDVENRLDRLVDAAGHDKAFYVIEAVRELMVHGVRIGNRREVYRDT